MPPIAHHFTATLACLVLLGACGTEDDGPSGAVLDDLVALHVVVGRDPATQPLELVDRRLDDERPVHAAQMLLSTAIPASSRQANAIEAVSVATGEGRGFQRRLLRAYRARTEALTAWEHVLRGGVSADPVEQLDALSGVREAEEALLAVIQEMDDLVPRERRVAPPPDPETDEADSEASGEPESRPGFPSPGGRGGATGGGRPTGGSIPGASPR